MDEKTRKIADDLMKEIVALSKMPSNYQNEMRLHQLDMELDGLCCQFDSS